MPQRKQNFDACLPTITSELLMNIFKTSKQKKKFHLCRKYEGYSESKDTSPVKMQGEFSFFRNGSAAV
jgi:hypothetical protein